MKQTKFLAIVVIASLCAVVAAQPTPAPPPPPAAGSGSAAAGEDDALYHCAHKTGAVSVTFKPETELKELITWVMGFTCKNFILDPRIVSTGKKVTVIAPLKMSQPEAYRVFLVALSTMGLTVVPKGNVLRIVESSTAKTETLPIYKKGIPSDEDQMVRYVLRPSYAKTEELRSALDAIKSPAGNVSAAGSMLIITDYSSQVRDMMTLAKAIDIPGNNDGIYTIPVHFADATQLAAKLSEILGVQAAAAGGASANKGQPGRPNAPPGQAPAAGGGGADDVAAAIPSKLLVDERTNTLIVVASEAGYLRVKSLVERLDIVLDTEGGSSIHVYPLDNALADELAQTLNNAMQGSNQQNKKPGQPGAPNIPQQQMPVSASGPAGGENLGSAIEGQVRIIGDKATNSLIVMSSGRDFIAIKDVIKKLDQPRRQVFIEAMILDVQLDKELDIGTSSHGGLPIDNSQALVLGGVQSNAISSLNPASLASLTGLIGGALGAPLTNSQTFLGTSIPSFGVLFQALATQDNTNILSTPHIIAINNEKAEFSVGNNIPYQAGLSFGGLGLPTTGTSGTSGTTIPGGIGQNIQREKLDLSLNVTPHISSDDIVRLEIEQETKDIGGKDPQLGPTWTERKVKTQVVIHDQQSVVIGGLVQDRDIYNVTKVPLLGDIPILGYLFKYSTKSRKKSNLLILLTPYIIKDQLDLQAIHERKLREYHEFTDAFSTLNEMKYEPKTDYRRKRGLIEEINRAVGAVEQDLETLSQGGHRVMVKGGVIEYGDSSIEMPEEGHGDGTSKPLPPPPNPPNPKKEPKK